MIISSSSFELHPTGSFYGKIVRIDEDISKFDAKPQLVLTVETEPIYGEKKERSLLYWTSTSLSPQSKLGSVYMAVSGEEVSAGLTIDTNDLLNRQAMVNIEHYERQDGQTGSRISAWKALN